MKLLDLLNVIKSGEIWLRQASSRDQKFAKYYLEAASGLYQAEKLVQDKQLDRLKDYIKLLKDTDRWEY